MRKRVLILPAAAIVIAGLCAWKLTREYEPPPRAEDLAFPRTAPEIPPLYDQNSREVRFERYLGRHEIFVVFYDGTLGVDKSPVMSFLRARAAALDARGIKVVGISQALPQENIGVTRVTETGGQVRSEREKYPFDLLSDIDLRVHKLWQRYDETEQRPLSGVFYVDRAGQVDARDNVPLPLENPTAFVRKLLGEADE